MFLPELAEHLASRILRRDALRIKKFLESNPASSYWIASDYASQDPNQPSDAFCYTIYPADDRYEDLVAEINSALPRDRKKKDPELLSDTAVACITDRRRFNLCFAINKDRSHFEGREQRIKSLSLQIAALRRIILDDSNGEYIRRLREFEQYSRRRSFNDKVLSDIMVASTIAAVIAFLITRYALGVKSIIWGSDRGIIIDAMKGISPILFHANWILLCQRRFTSTAGVATLFMEGGQPGGEWIDELVRVPDYLAATLSSVSLATGRFKQDAAKHQVAFAFLFMTPAGKLDWHSNTRTYRLTLHPSRTLVESLTFGPKVFGDDDAADVWKALLRLAGNG